MAVRVIEEHIQRLLSGEQVDSILVSMLVKESDIKDVDIESILTKDVLLDLMESDRDLILDYYLDDLEDSGGDPDEVDYATIEDDPSFLSWLRDYFSGEFSKVKRQMSRLFKPGRVKIYREITVPDVRTWAKNTSSGRSALGVFWSYDKDAAHSWYGEEKEQHPYRILLTSEVDKSGVDWDETLRLNIVPGTGEEEKEIRLFEGVPLKLIDIKVFSDGTEVSLDISEIDNKVFYA